ncbi:MAG: MFS transporter [Candidatus Lokiarchaeota archaeon]|nr:MFS transporter [Candidatus Lokiarchaeota archaeon]
MENNKSEKLTNKQMLGYSFGGIPMALLGFVFTLYYVEFFFDDLQLLPIYFIVGQIIYAIVNAINDPLLGQLSDRTDRKKWGGRRLPYIKWGAPIWGLTLIFTFFPFVGPENQILLFIHFVVSICAYDTMLTLVVLCWMALMPEMTTDIDERNKINFFVLIWAVIGVLPFFFILPIFKVAGFPWFQILNTIIAIVSIICYWIVVKTSEEKPEFQKDEVFPLWKSIKKTLKLKSFLVFIGYNFCSVFNSSIGFSYLFTYIFILGIDPGLAIALFFCVFLFIGYGSNYLCMKLRSKWSMKKIILRFGILKVIGAFITFILILNPITESLIWFGFIWTTFFGGYSVFTVPIMSLSMDEDEVNQGTRREGMFLGMNAFFTKPAQSLGPIIATIILTTYGYAQGEIIQTPEALFGIKILFLLVPAVASLISLIVIYFYPLYGDRLKDLQVRLEEIHQQKRKRLTSALKN